MLIVFKDKSPMNIFLLREDAGCFLKSFKVNEDLTILSSLSLPSTTTHEMLGVHMLHCTCRYTTQQDHTENHTTVQRGTCSYIIN